MNGKSIRHRCLPNVPALTRGRHENVTTLEEQEESCGANGRYGARRVQRHVSRPPNGSGHPSCRNPASGGDPSVWSDLEPPSREARRVRKWASARPAKDPDPHHGCGRGQQHLRQPCWSIPEALSARARTVQAKAPIQIHEPEVRLTIFTLDNVARLPNRLTLGFGITRPQNAPRNRRCA